MYPPTRRAVLARLSFVPINSYLNKYQIGYPGKKTRVIIIQKTNSDSVSSSQNSFELNGRSSFFLINFFHNNESGSSKIKKINALNRWLKPSRIITSTIFW